MARCERGDAGSLAAAGGFRLWLDFSAAAFRRKLLEAMMCGVSKHRRKGGAAFGSPEQRPRKPRSERLAELLRAEVSVAGSDEVEAETRQRMVVFEELQLVVGRLQSGGGDNVGGDRRKEAAGEVRRLSKDNAETRKTLAMLGAIPPLVGMLDSPDIDFQISALYALLNLGIGNDLNKAAVVKAGAVHKMLSLIESGSSPSVSEAIVANFLGLSALDSNKPVIGSSGAIPFLVRAFKNPSGTAGGGGSSQERHDALRALFNLSIAAANTPYLIDADIVPCLLAAVSDVEVSERVLSVISNLVAAPEGRRAVSRSRDAFPILVDVLNWSDAPGCQEKAAYVLMVMAHKSYGDWAAMIEAGIMSSLLELTLLGSPLAQKRASRILEILRVDKGKQVSEGFGEGGGGGCCGVPAVSAPLVGGAAEGEEEEAGMSEERRAVRQLVQQSLQSNMRRIVRRANLPQDFATSDHLEALAASSTSKSLPF
ncbi:U-box domain-containing protein 12-like [Phoenix dactylifera]|uniref:U-box domain-containing protein 12-like n=1 Tax=Phoenix dactylifera TaxID=42345 RepID=A0A8B7MVE5_PHODC|nr:U-box domain-containing protein 12-like [Phoenix dactylifera]XP_017699101.2 U-box domain-containing protein 12-like [Phoenix dactylifera]XP_017699102.2 U-box domain-containing protein 12-like [Phoenix dactylifera]